jgi:hypothetical protein
VPEIGYHFFAMETRLNVDRSAINGAMYGLLLAGLFGGANAIAWTPLWVLVWSYQALMIAIAAILTWRRMAMRWMTGAMMLAAISSGIIAAFYATGWTLEDIALRWPYVSFPAVAAIPTLVLLSQWREARQWKEWRMRTEGVTFRDMFVFRHIPDMRSDRIWRT